MWKSLDWVAGEHKRLMDRPEFKNMRQDDARSQESVPLLEALDLAEVAAPSKRPSLQPPSLHKSSSQRKRRRSINGEDLSETKVANISKRFDELDKKKQELEETRKMVMRKRAERKRRRAENN